jgi:hypothetical protein
MRLVFLNHFFVFKVTLSYQAKEQLERIVFGGVAGVAGVAGLCHIVTAGSFFSFLWSVFHFLQV